MKKGGFSITSWPTLMMQSASSIARWQKSPAESAAQPRNSGCRSSSTPLPIWVVTKGMPVLSTNSPSILLVILRFAPAPMTSTGAFALLIASAASLTALGSADGRRATERGIGWLSVISSAISSGNSRCTAPGFSSSARRNASRIRLGILSPAASWCAYLVIGPIMSTTSRIWNLPCFDFLIGFCPVIIIIGMPPSWA